MLPRTPDLSYPRVCGTRRERRSAYGVGHDVRVAADNGDVLDQFRAALDGVGYGELLAEFEDEDESRDVTLERLTGALLSGIVPAMRARAESMRLLAAAEAVEDDDSNLDPGFSRQDEVRVPINEPAAQRLESLADRLERALTELRRSNDADSD